MTLHCQVCDTDQTEYEQSELMTCVDCGKQFLPCCDSDDGEDVCCDCYEDTIDEDDDYEEDEDEDDEDEVMDRLEDDIDRDEEGGYSDEKDDDT